MHSSIKTTYTCILLMILCGSVSAGEWLIDPYFDIQEIYTDNINLNDDNKQDEFITLLRPALFSVYEGNRYKSRFHYALEQYIYANDTPDDAIHRLDFDNLYEVVNDHLFFDFSVENDEQLLNSTASLAEDNLSNSSNREDVFYYRINPFWKQKISEWANATLGHTYDEIISDIGDSRSNFSYLNIINGNRVSRVLFDFKFTNRIIEFESADDVRFTNLQNRFIYPLTSTFSPTFTIGYDDDDFESASDTTGVLWGVGFIWRPSQRTNLDITVGERYFGSNILANASHKRGNTLFTLTFNETQLTTRDALFDDSAIDIYQAGASGLLDENGEINTEDRRLGGLTALEAANLDQVNDTVIISRLDAQIEHDDPRNFWRLTTTISEDEFQTTGTTLDTFGAVFNYRRKLTRTLTANVDSYYENRQAFIGGETFDYAIGTGLTKQLTRSFNIYFQYRLARFEANTPLINEFTENRALIGIYKVF